VKQALETQPTHWSYFCQRKQEIESTRTIKNQFIRHGRSNVNIEPETILTNKHLTILQLVSEHLTSSISTPIWKKVKNVSGRGEVQFQAKFLTV